MFYEGFHGRGAAVTSGPLLKPDSLRNWFGFIPGLRVIGSEILFGGTTGQPLGQNHHSMTHLSDHNLSRNIAQINTHRGNKEAAILQTKRSPMGKFCMVEVFGGVYSLVFWGAFGA